MKYLLRLPRWLAGAFLLFTVPALAAQPAVAFDCSTVQYFRQTYSEAELHTMALAHGYSEADIAKAEKCMPKAAAKPKADIEVTKRSSTLPPVHTAKTTKPKASPVAPAAAPVVVEAPAPVVVVEAPVAAPAPVKSSWLWDFLTDLGLIVLIGSAVGIFVNVIRKWRAASAIATIAKV